MFLYIVVCRGGSSWEWGEDIIMEYFSSSMSSSGSEEVIWRIEKSTRERESEEGNTSSRSQLDGDSGERK
jgi:hypothetical protein